jgi:hypothetical protein
MSSIFYNLTVRHGWVVRLIQWYKELRGGRDFGNWLGSTTLIHLERNLVIIRDNCNVLNPV